MLGVQKSTCMGMCYSQKCNDVLQDLPSRCATEGLQLQQCAVFKQWEAVPSRHCHATADPSYSS
jgi:hypothetical protein